MKRMSPVFQKRVPIWTLFFVLGFVAYIFSCKKKQPVRVAIDKTQLGKLLFFDENLSEPAGQSCAACHDPARGFADKDLRAVSEGAVKGLFSNRNALSVSYSAYIPALSYNEKEKTYQGGFFWDGRSNSLEDQAKQPFLNPLEMGNKDAKAVVDKVKKAAYYADLTRLYGNLNDTTALFNAIADAIAIYERSDEVNPFSSKYDAFLEGKYTLTADEAEGMKLFKGKGLCAECHSMDPDPAAHKALFTDHTYDNLGIPVLPGNPFYTLPKKFNPHGEKAMDLGLGSIVKSGDENGKFRVPTLRNIELTPPYGHNGYFKTLEEIVHFYNIRDVSSEFPNAEHPQTVNKEELGNLKLTPLEEHQIVAFLKLLMDGYKN